MNIAGGMMTVFRLSSNMILFLSTIWTEKKEEATEGVRVFKKNVMSEGLKRRCGAISRKNKSVP